MSKISLIITVKNEAATITDLLSSIVRQVRLPDEVVIVDGDSTDQTTEKVYQFIEDSKRKQDVLSWQVISQPSNISQGRNLAISRATYELLAITDAGCTLEENWLAELEKSYLSSKKAQGTEVVVAGYYRGAPQSSFEAAVVPYVLVMPDQINPESFLPATRSMLLPKNIWQELGGFDEHLQVSEDYAFAHAIVKKYGPQKIVFCETAIVNWRPRSNLQAFYAMIFKMAEGDIRAGIVRGKVKLLVGRYLGGGLILLAVLKGMSWLGLGVLVGGVIAYLVWAIFKNKKYLGDGWYWLPILQITADMAVLLGSLSGLGYRSVTE
jgi:glycosyltransferase involved in cell wall biosynthesis